jgi:hypothetical protein
MIYGELGLFPIEIDVKLRMISYWARLLTGKETKLSYLSYLIAFGEFCIRECHSCVNCSWRRFIIKAKSRSEF